MLLSTNPSLREIIMQTLIERGASTASDVHTQIKLSRRSCSVQAVYLELGTLVRSGAVIKVRKTYQVALQWVARLLEFSELVANKFLSRNSELFSFPAKGKKLRLEFFYSPRSDDFWMHCVLTLLRKTGEKTIYQSLPHPWHHLTKSGGKSDFESALRRLKAKDFILIGGNTYLDRLATNRWPKEIFTYRHSPSHSQRNPLEALTLIGDYIITTHYPTRFRNDIEEYYQRIKYPHEIRAQDILRIFGQRMKITVAIAHHPRKAQNARKVFDTYFTNKR